jgi:hypothetical protein
MTSSTRNFRQALGTAAIAALALAGPLSPARATNHQGSSIMTMKQDLADREKDIHWPAGFNPSQADLFSHNALLINASCERIWGHIVDATKWPQWYPNSKDVRMDGGDVLKEGTGTSEALFGEQKADGCRPRDSIQRRSGTSRAVSRTFRSEPGFSTGVETVPGCRRRRIHFLHPR